MKPNRSKIIAFVFVGFLALVSLQTFLKVLPDPVPNGVKLQAKRLPLTASLWFSGQFQAAFESWMKDHVGFRSVWLKTENQLNFSLFRQVKAVPGDAGTSIVLGRQDWLYEKWYIQAYLNSGRSADGLAEESARRLKRVQDLLARTGVPFLFVISPSKAEAYPQYIPEKYLRYSVRDEHNTDHQKMIRALEREQVNTIDGPGIIREAIREEPYLLFPQGGVHWDYLGGELVLQQILARINAAREYPIPIPAIAEIKLEKPQGRDRDLSDLLFLWSSHATDSRTPYPLFAIAPSDGSKKLNLLIIGDSFNFTLIELLEQMKVIDRVEFLAWYRRRMIIPSWQNDPFEPQRTVWEELVADRDAVIYCMNESDLPGLKWDFVDDFIRYFQRFEKTASAWTAGLPVGRP